MRESFRKRMKKKMAGFHTVEAAFVMTIGIFALLSLLLLTFYLHDVQSLRAEWNSLADRAAAEGWNTERLEYELKQKTDSLHLLILDVQKAEVRHETVLLTEEAVMAARVRCPVPFYAEHFFQNIVSGGSLEVRVEPFSPEKTMRQLEAVKEVME